jgi:hypothetical protein
MPTSEDAGKRADELIAAGKTGSDDLTPDDLDLEALSDSEDQDQEDPDSEAWKHKYSVLQGKYNAEIGRLQDALSTTLLEKERLAARGTGDPIKEAVDRKVSDLEEQIAYIKEEYPNMFEGISALIDQKVSAGIAEGLKPLATTVASVSAGQVRSDQEKYFESLDNDIGGWREINKSPKFLQWLQEADRYTGASRHELLSRAYNSMNVASTKAFFEDFAKESGMEITIDTEKPPKMEVHARKSESSFDISPTSTSGRVDPKPPKGNLVLRADIETFYKDRAMGRFAGTEEDAAKTEARILKAVQEGNVR